MRRVRGGVRAADARLERRALPDEEYGVAWDHLRALELLAASAPLRLLEIGCAEGRFLERAAGLGHRATGLDFNAAAVRSARARGLDARQGDVASLHAALEPGERFQAVAMFQIIEHLCDPDALFAALGSVVARAPSCWRGARLRCATRGGWRTPSAWGAATSGTGRRSTRCAGGSARCGSSWPATAGAWSGRSTSRSPAGRGAHVTGCAGRERSPLRRRVETPRVAAWRPRGRAAAVRVRLLVVARREEA
jgi:hypothetical protein